MSVQRIAVAVIGLYRRFISPVLPAACRFYPSCSQYAKLAIERHGLIPGALLALGRLGRCHPWHPGGVDLVPDRLSEQ